MISKNQYMKYLILFFVLIFVSGNGIAGAVRMSPYKGKTFLLKENLYPDFVKLFDYPKNVVAHFEIESNFPETTDELNKIIDFYRVEQLNEDSTVVLEFTDFSKSGKQIRRGVLKKDLTYQTVEYFAEQSGVKAEYSLKFEGINKEFKYYGLSIVKHPEKAQEVLTVYLPSFDYAQRIGETKEFHDNGALKSYYRQNQNGLFDDNFVHTSFYSSGQKEYMFTTKNGKYHDTLIHFSEEGAILEHIIYNEGKPIQKIKAKAPQDNHKALIINISENQKSEFKINANRDAELIEEALRNKQFKAKNITLLENEKATLKGIKNTFETFVKEAQFGDICYIHISASAYLNSSEDEGISPYDSEDNSLITFDEILFYTKELRNKIGIGGQVTLTLDACVENKLEETEVSNTADNNRSRGYRAQIQEHLLNTTRKRLAPLNIIGVQGLAYETIDEENNKVGELSYLLASALKFYPVFSFEELERNIISRKMPNKNSFHIVGDQNSSIFQTDFTEKELEESDYRLKGNAWIVSVGISDYKVADNSGLIFKNCVNDAKSYADLFESEFMRSFPEDEKVYNHLLLNQKATKENIIHVLDSVSKFANEDDYFIFNFSGFTVTYNNDNKEEETWFVTANISDIYDTLDIKQNGVNLQLLKGLLQQIDCRNQLFITEAGNTKNFGKEFTKALIEDQSISELVDRNRLILVPNAFGYDFFNCDMTKIESGPINYFLNSLPYEMNIFDLFGGTEKSKKVEFELTKKQLACGFKTSYFRFFREREILNDLEFYTSNRQIVSRGAKAVFREKRSKEKLGSKTALVIGTNSYRSSDGEWSDLRNPVNDAKAIANELENKYGFHVELLIDPPLDSIYNYLYEYSKSLDTSDQFILFIAGHGDFDNYLDDGMIVCSDSRSSITDVGRNSYLQFGKLSRIINRFNAKQVMVLLDVCFGGAFNSQVALKRNRSKNDMYEGRDQDHFVDDQLKYTTRKYMTSGAKNEVPDGYGKHSPFAHILLQVLRNSDSEVLTGTKIYSFLQTLDSKPLFGSFGDDEPGSDFLLIAD